MTLVGDVKDKIAILVDDMADTCGTLCKAADVLMENGAKEVVAIVTHGILSGDACEKVSNSKLSRLVVTDTVPHEDKKKRCAKIDTIDVAPTVGSFPCEEGMKANMGASRSRRRADERIMARASLSSSAT
jgi:ribose-phosphate pyrophosphokinase